MRLDTSKFIKTFFTFSNIEFDKSYVKYWTECGFNVASTFAFNPLKHNKENMLEILKEADKNGIKVLVSDIRVSYKRLKEVGKEIFTKEAKEAYEFYKNEPSFIGFFLGDEPWANEIPYVIESNHILLLIDPRLLNFVNFFPYCDNDKVLEILGCDPEEYDKKLASIIEEAQLKIWGIDHYGILWVHEQDRGLFQYFKTIDVAQYVSKRTNTNCIFAGSIIRHNNCIEPSFDMVRYQTSISLMNGLKGINWYKFYDTNEGLNSLRNGCGNNFPINCYKEKTKSFYDIKETNRWLYKKILPLINDLSFDSSNMIDGGKDNKVSYDEELVSFYSDHGLPIMVSKFINKEGKPVYFAMNLSVDKPEVIIYNFKNLYKDGSSWMLPGEMILISHEK